ncbi:MAG: M23 family metallopeptidase [Clostridia bacterium]|nr:M23 family metallopeptidase [Clostridia bacterium]
MECIVFAWYGKNIVVTLNAVLARKEIKMERKREKKRDEVGLYIAIVCCVLAIAVLGYVNSSKEKNEVKERLLSEEVGENVIVPETIKSNPTPLPVLTGEEEQEIIIPSEKPVAKAQEVKEEARLSKPVGGDIHEEYKGTLVYYPVIGEWRTHNGVDISCEIGDSVTASADGVVLEHTVDSMGYGIKIDHGDGLITVYSNLQENPNVKIGDPVKKGDVIGYVGQSALADLSDKMHLHFEVIENGEYKNPKDYLG